jgi:hypothetical protein
MESHRREKRGGIKMAVEDFTTYTEVDPATKLTVTPTRVTWNDMAQSQTLTYVYRNLTATPVGDFTFDFTIQTSAADTYSNVIYICLINSLADFYDTYVPYDDELSLRYESNVGGVKARICMRDNSNNNQDETANIAPSFTKYCRLNRIGTTVTCSIYDDSAHTSLYDTLIITGSSTLYDYIMVGQSYGYTSGNHQTGYIENLELVSWSSTLAICDFHVTTSSGIIFDLSKPHTLGYADSRNIVRFNFWTGTSYTGDIGKASETIMLDGTESDDVAVHLMDDAVDNGDVLTLSGFNDPLLDTTWVVRNFTFTRETYNEYSWSLTLEKK